MAQNINGEIKLNTDENECNITTHIIKGIILLSTFKTTL